MDLVANEEVVRLVKSLGRRVSGRGVWRDLGGAVRHGCKHTGAPRHLFPPPLRRTAFYLPSQQGLVFFLTGVVFSLLVQQDIHDILCFNLPGRDDGVAAQLAGGTYWGVWRGWHPLRMGSRGKQGGGVVGSGSRQIRIDGAARGVRSRGASIAGNGGYGKWGLMRIQHHGGFGGGGPPTAGVFTLCFLCSLTLRRYACRCITSPSGHIPN